MTRGFSANAPFWRSKNTPFSSWRGSLWIPTAAPCFGQTQHFRVTLEIYLDKVFDCNTTLPTCEVECEPNKKHPALADKLRCK